MHVLSPTRVFKRDSLEGATAASGRTRQKRGTAIRSVSSSSTAAAVFSLSATFSFPSSPLCLPSPQRALNMQDCPSTILGIIRSHNHTHTHTCAHKHTHTAYLLLPLSLVPFSALSKPTVLGSVSANDFRKMPSSVKKKKKRKERKKKKEAVERIKKAKR